MKKYGFGVDIGGTTIKVGFFETSGKLIDKWEIKTNTDNEGSEILSDVAKAIDNKLAQERISKDQVQGIGIGVPGPVKPDGTVIYIPNSFSAFSWVIFSQSAWEISRLSSKRISIFAVCQGLSVPKSILSAPCFSIIFCA